jgi:hypothetical protein
MPVDLTDADKTTLAADRFPLSPRVRRWKAIRDTVKLNVGQMLRRETWR